MATLFDRLIGLDLQLPPTPSEEKIAIHSFSGCINFYGTGDVTGQNLAAWFNLVGEQRDDAIYQAQLADDAQAIGQRSAFMRVYKDGLYNGETRTAPGFTSEQNWYQKLFDVVADSGGTPTPLPQYLKDRWGI